MFVSEAITCVTFITLSTNEASIIKTGRESNHISEQIRRPNLCLQNLKSKHCSFSELFSSSLDNFKHGAKQESKLICPGTKHTFVQEFIQRDMVKFCQSHHHHILLCLLRAQLNPRNLYKVKLFL